MQFILFLDQVGAEFTKARVTRKDIVALAHGTLLRLRPLTIKPLQVIEDKGAAKRAAGGFLLLGPIGAALCGKGAQVLFELVEHDGTVRKGIIWQDEYKLLRKAVERMKSYKPGETRKNIAALAGFLLLLATFVAATGPAGFVIAPVLWFGGGALVQRLFGRRAQHDTARRSDHSPRLCRVRLCGFALRLPRASHGGRQARDLDDRIRAAG